MNLRLSRAVWVGVVCLVSLVSRTAQGAAAEPWDGHLFSATPAEVLQAAAAGPTPKDADVEVLFEEVVFSFDAQGRQQSTTRQVRRFLTQKAVDEEASISSPWSPWCEEKPSLRARVITPDGAAHLLDAKSIAEAPADQREGNVLSDRRVLIAPLPALAPKAVAEEEIVVRQRQAFFAPGIVAHFALGSFYPTRKLRLVVEVPAGAALRYEVRGSDLKPARSEKGGRLKLVFETRPAKVLKLPEPFLPPDLPYWPEVVFSTGKSWAEVAAGYDALVRPQIDLEAVKPIVREAAGGESNREKVAARLLAKLQKLVRYTGVEFGNAEIVPRTPRQTLQRGYGDCKDQATLLVAMLRAAGTPANVALLRAGNGPDVVPDMPGLGRFNHAIVYVRGNPPLWIDPSASYVPAGQLPLSDQGRWAMIVDPAAKALVRIPAGDYRKNRSSKTIEYTVRNSNDSRVREVLSYGGSCEQELRGAFASGNEEDLRKRWRSYAKETYHALSVTRVEHTSPHDLATPFRVVLDAEKASVAAVDDDAAVVPLKPAALFIRLPELFLRKPAENSAGGERPEPDEENPAAAERKRPLVLAEPHVRELTYEVTPPPGFVPAALPAGETRHLGPATIGWSFQTRGDKVVATFRLDTGPGAFTAAEVEALRRAIAGLGPEGDVARWTVSLKFRHAGAVHLAAGRFKEALAVYRRLAEQYPAQSEQHWRYALALLRAGLGEAARREARRAVAADPQSYVAQADLGFVLIHDLVGRAFRRGMDRRGAEAAYRKALALKPGSRVTRLDYAILLEHDDAGWRYGPGADLKRAIAEYRKVLADAGSLGSHSINLALDLLLDGDFAELEKFAVQQHDPPEIWKSLAVAAIAAQHDAAAGEKKAAEISLDSKQRRLILATASDYLDKARLYPQSAALLDFLVDGANDARLKTIRAVRRALRPFERFQLPARDPRHVVQQFLRSVLSDGECGPPLAALCVKDATEADRKLLAGEVEVVFGKTRALAREHDTPPQRTGDAALLVPLRSEGNDAIGYRVRPAGPISRGVEWYVVRRDNEYRVFVQGPRCANLGCLILDRLDVHDEQGAKRWLQWAWEANKPSASWLNPFAGSPFGEFWLVADAGRPENVRLAAAMLLAGGSAPQRAAPLLAEARKGTKNLGLQLQIDRASLMAYDRGHRPADVRDTADRILQGHDRPELVAAKLTALYQLGKRDELRRILEERLKKTGLDARLQEWLASLAARLGQFDLAMPQLRALAEHGKLSRRGRNELAWSSLFDGSVSAASLDTITAAAKQSAYADPVILHTLATIDAELGKPADSIRALWLSIEAGDGVPNDRDWYVAGRIAENCGLIDDAVALYRKVRAPERVLGNGTYVLAQQRLRKLSPHPTPGSQPPVP